VEDDATSSNAAADVLDLVARLDDDGPVATASLPVAALQPIVHLEAAVPIGFEALARFDDGVDPGTHFARAVAEGRIVELELECCRAALQRLDELPAGTFVSMNVSLASLTTPDLPMLFRRVDTTRVAIEVTQQSPVDDAIVLDHHLAPLKSTGARIAIDDVGVGDFSIERIAKTTPAMIKAAPRLVTDCDRDESLHHQLRHVAELGRRLGAITIGVGVERPTEAEVLRNIGFDAAQGYLFGKPQT